MTPKPEVLISAFGDEGRKPIGEQFSALAAIGLRYVSLRFLVLGKTGDQATSADIGHIMKIDGPQRAHVRRMVDAYGLQVAEIGTAIGKSKIVDQEDDTKNAFLTLDQILDQTRHGLTVCHELDCHILRGFSFYHPKGSDPAQYLSKAIDYIGRIGDLCRAAAKVFALEIEANLIGQDGWVLAEIVKKVGNPNVVLVWDGANVTSRGIREPECMTHFDAVKPHMGYFHVKDYRLPPDAKPTTHLDEEALRHFVPAGQGDSGYRAVMWAIKEDFAAIHARVKALGLPGIFATLEPHVKGGGQFGGKSGPDGLGVAARAFCGVLDSVGIGYSLRGIDDVKGLADF